MTNTRCLIVAVGCWLAGWAYAEGMPKAKRHTNSVGMNLVRIEAGSFVMGSAAGAISTRGRPTR